MYSSRWPPVPVPHRRAHSGHARCTRCWSVTRPSPDGCVSSTTAQSLPLDCCSARLRAEADIERIVFDAPDRVLSVSHRRRFTGALRRAIEVRDRHCQHPSGCDIRAPRCDIDHITPWTQTRDTSQVNGRVMCAVTQIATRQGPVAPRRAGSAKSVGSRGFTIRVRPVWRNAPSRVAQSMGAEPGEVTVSEEASQTVPARARCVVIGAGIVGNCLVGHLARLGWTDIVLLDKGPLPNPGGSTGHASNFIFPTDHNKEMAFLTLESQRQYVEHGLNNDVRRHRGGARAGTARGVQPADDVGEGVGHRRPAGHAGGDQGARAVRQRGASCSAASTRRACRWSTRCRAGTLMREEAVAKGALQVFANTEVLDIEVGDGAGGRPCGVVTDKGRIEAEHVGDRLRRVEPTHRRDGRRDDPAHARGAPDGRRRPDRHPAGESARRSPTRSSATWTRSATSASRPARWRSAPTPTGRSSTTPTTSRRTRSRRCRPTELPFTADDFDPQLEEAIELMGEILETAEIRYAINGLLSLTPDAMPVLGETVEVAQPVVAPRRCGSRRARASPSSSPSG